MARTASKKINRTVSVINDKFELKEEKVSIDKPVKFKTLAAALNGITEEEAIEMRFALDCDKAVEKLRTEVEGAAFDEKKLFKALEMVAESPLFAARLKPFLDNEDSKGYDKELLKIAAESIPMHPYLIAVAGIAKKPETTETETPKTPEPPEPPNPPKGGKK